MVNKSIEITVKNQLFTSDNSSINLYYNVRYKGHYGTDWRILYGSPDDYPIQSGSEYTVISLPSNFPVGAQVDFQVQALIGTVTLIEARLWGVPNYYEFDGETSGWSDARTLLIPADTTTPPSDGGTQPIEPSSFILGVAITAIAVLLGAGLLFYFKKRKR